MFDNLFTIEPTQRAGTFVTCSERLFLLFIAISFFVALLQVWVSKERIKRILSRPQCKTNAVLGAALGTVTPFCSCSTIPVLVGLFKSGTLLGSHIVPDDVAHPQPAIIALLLVFFGPVPTAVYAVITFVFAVCVGLLLDALRFSRYIKNVAVKGGCCGGEEATWENLKGTFWQKQAQACKYALKDAIGLFKGFIGWLLLGAGIGAFIYGFVPTELLEGFAGADNLWAIPLAAVIGIPMYIRVETMIPIAGILMEKGVSSGIVIALILGGAGCSIPEVSLLNSIFKKPMVVTFLYCASCSWPSAPASRSRSSCRNVTRGKQNRKPLRERINRNGTFRKDIRQGRKEGELLLRDGDRGVVRGRYRRAVRLRGRLRCAWDGINHAHGAGPGMQALPPAPRERPGRCFEGRRLGGRRVRYRPGRDSRGGNHVHARAAREREGRLAGKGARAGRDCGAAIAVRRRREKECE